MTSQRFQIPLNFKRLNLETMHNRAQEFQSLMQQRRSVRDFSNEVVPIAIINQALLTAGSAPSGANLQPWHFSVVTDPLIKTEIQQKAEQEERQFYESRAPKTWLNALKPLQTNASKPFLFEAPVLIVIFMQKQVRNHKKQTVKSYYPNESVGIATGFLISALHYSGLATLTHTPSPMKFLNTILKRPTTDKPYLILVVGYPKKGTTVPNIKRKALKNIADYF